MEDFDNTVVENNKRKRSDSEVEQSPLELLQTKIACDILLRLKTEISEFQKFNKNFNVALYIKNYRSLLVKEKKRINRKQACKDVITFHDFLERGSIELTTQVGIKIFDEILKVRKSHTPVSSFNVVEFIDKKLETLKAEQESAIKKAKMEIGYDDNDQDQEEGEEIVLDDEEDEDEDEKRHHTRSKTSSHYRFESLSEDESSNEDDDVDERGNIKGLIAYSDDDESEYEESSEDESSDEETSEDDKKFNKNHNRRSAQKNAKSLLTEAEKQYEKQFFKIKYQNEEQDDDECINYFRKMSDFDKDATLEKMNELESYDIQNKPLYFKVLEMDLSMHQKSIILKKIKTLECLDPGQNDYVKLNSWVTKLMSVPFGVYSNRPVSLNDDKKVVRQHLNHIKETMDAAIWGHDNAKSQILQIMAQEVKNPECKGHVMAIYGPMGNGKTTLVKEGIAKAMGRSFAFISLGGATDASFLEGHSYTYEGSICGKIVDVLIKAKCMDPIIYFDELDKVSQTGKGEEIVNILMHLTDPSQNEHFTDKYFTEIDFDLSKATLIFSYNDASKISPILRDRLTNIKTAYLKTNEKVYIAKNYLLPKILQDIGLKENTIKFNEKIIMHIIDNYTFEGGVRKLKETLYEIVRKINLKELSGEKLLGRKIKYPVKITKDILTRELFNEKVEMTHQGILDTPRVGLVNGLYASTAGVGGLTRVESSFMPSNTMLDLKLTGMQGDVMKESMHVAKTVAWNLLPKSTKKSLRKTWSSEGDSGIHIHCPEGATPKDGPSAGGAITTALLSLLSNIPVRNDIAMTGEIDLNGYIHAIGGLEEKLEGAKRAGVKLALCPEENKSDLDTIKRKNTRLFEGEFEVKTVKNIKEIISVVFTKKLNMDETILSFR